MDSMVNLLIAFPYFKKPLIESLRLIPKSEYRLIVDSGAFTAWNVGKEVKLDDYCKFLDSIECLRPFQAVQLDVIGDPEKTWKNFLIMKQRGYDVMPVFTRGDSFERCNEMYSYTDYIMLGGVSTGAKNTNYVKWFMEQNGDRKVHWLGFCNSDFVKHYKPFSIDSSSWSSGARFGSLCLYRGRGEIQVFSRKNLLSMPPEKFFSMGKKSGITHKELGLLQHSQSWVNVNITPDLTKPEGNVAMLITAISSIHRAAEIEKNCGTRFYMALMDQNQLHLIFSARNFLIQRGIIKGKIYKGERFSKPIRRPKKETNATKS